jgi:tetratricopeptide (TPR) repeat protein
LILFKASEASPFIRWNVSDLKCVPKAISSGRDNGCNFSMSAFLSESPLRRRYPKTYEEYESVIRSDKTGTLADLQNYFSGALEDSCRSPYVARLLFTSNNSNVILWNLIKNDPIRAFKKGCLALRNGSPDATSDFVEAIKEDPLNAHAYRQLAFSYWRSGNRKEALRNHQRHAVVPASFYTNSCHCSTDEQRLDEAIKLVLVKSEEEKAVALSKGKSAEALAKINAAIQMNPVDPDLVLLSGSLKGELGDYNGALKDYNEAVELTDVESHWRESTFKNDASQNGSIQQLKDFRGVVLSHRAKAMLDQKKPELAAEDLREALRIASPGWHLKAEVEMKLRELEGSGKTEGGGKALEGQGR